MSRQQSLLLIIIYIIQHTLRLHTATATATATATIIIPHLAIYNYSHVYLTTPYVLVQ